MNAPFYKFGLFGDDASLFIAFVIGLGFGFFLERAGFGSGNKLAKQFYFRDMAVLKVMFTAIITAMLGVFWLGRLGWLDVSLVYLTPTAWLSNVVGGLILGVGFVIGGYCPGTSVVAAATGRIDAMLYMVGMFAGMLAVGFVMPALDEFMHVGDVGPLTLAAAWNVSYGVMVALVLLMAAGAFLLAEWGEVKSGAKQRSEQPLLGAVGFSSSRRLVLTMVALGVVAAVAGTPYRGHVVKVRSEELTALVAHDADALTPEVLAERLVSGVETMRVVDLRSADEFARYHLPSAENVPLPSLAQFEARPDERMLLYAESEAQAAKAWVLLRSRGLHVYVLAGGLEGWKAHVLFPRLVAGVAPTENERRAQLARHFGGTPRAESSTSSSGSMEPTPPVPLPPPPAPAADQPAPTKKKKKEGC